MCTTRRLRFTCGHVSRILETAACAHRTMLAEWLADDTPTPQVFRDLAAGQCEAATRDEFEERERICGACRMTAREEEEEEEEQEEEEREREGKGEGKREGKGEGKGKGERGTEEIKARRVHWEDGGGEGR